MRIIEDYRSESKILSYTFDNASVNNHVIDKPCRVLNPDLWFSISCFLCVSRL